MIRHALRRLAWWVLRQTDAVHRDPVETCVPCTGHSSRTFFAHIGVVHPGPPATQSRTYPPSGGAGGSRPGLLHPTQWHPVRGDIVVLTRADRYLSEYHGAIVGSRGTVIEDATQPEGPPGVLVDWGSGGRVRCNLTELAPEPA